MTSDAIRNSESGQADMARYCFDDAFLAGVDRLAGPDAQGDYSSLTELDLTFLNGNGPAVGDYRAHGLRVRKSPPFYDAGRELKQGNWS